MQLLVSNKMKTLLPISGWCFGYGLGVGGTAGLHKVLDVLLYAILPHADLRGLQAADVVAVIVRTVKLTTTTPTSTWKTVLAQPSHGGRKDAERQRQNEGVE